jgi:antitoxin HicB
MTERFYTIVVSRLSAEDGGGYLARAVDLYGCFGDGDTPAAAVEDLQSAVKEWIAEMTRLGREIPEPGSAIKEATEERRRLMELIKAQHELLEFQAQHISEQDETLREMRARIERLSSEILQITESSRHRGEDRSWMASIDVPDRPDRSHVH